VLVVSDQSQDSELPTWSGARTSSLVDCGFGTFAGRVQVDTKIVWLKLQSLAEGARRTPAHLWGKGV
jgi:hypothetical protein